MSTITSLRDIPLAVFSEFTGLPTNYPRAEYFDTCGHPYSVIIAPAKVHGSNGPFTLVHKWRNCGPGRFHREELLAYGFPITLEAFEPQAEGGLLGPNDFHLGIVYSTDDPPYGNLEYRTWEMGKGYWVKDSLTVALGSGVYSKISLISDYGDWEFAFLLKLQRRAHLLAQLVASRGHWQVEHNPRGEWLTQKMGLKSA